jgi:membrane protease YdiL (CAAX protease family)
MITFLNWPELWLNLARLLILLFTTAMAWMTYRSYLLLKEIEPQFNVLLSLPETVVRIVLVGFCLFLAWLSGLPASELGLTADRPGRSLALGTSIGLITALSINAITLLAIRYFGRHIYSPWLIRNILPRSTNEWLFIALAFFFSVAMEELLFRTLLISVFQDLIPLPLLIILTSIAFGLMHQPQGRLGMVVSGLINVLFCILFVWTGELLVTFTAHYVVNLSQLVVGYYQRDWLENYS